MALEWSELSHKVETAYRNRRGEEVQAHDRWAEIGQAELTQLLVGFDPEDEAAEDLLEERVWLFEVVQENVRMVFLKYDKLTGPEEGAEPLQVYRRRGMLEAEVPETYAEAEALLGALNTLAAEVDWTYGPLASHILEAVKQVEEQQFRRQSPEAYAAEQAALAAKAARSEAERAERVKVWEVEQAAEGAEAILRFYRTLHASTFAPETPLAGVLSGWGGECEVEGSFATYEDFLWITHDFFKGRKPKGEYTLAGCYRLEAAVTEQAKRNLDKLGYGHDGKPLPTAVESLEGVELERPYTITDSAEEK